MKKILISGGNSGMGLEAARQLTALGHQVLLIGRDARKGEEAVSSLRSNPGQAAFLAADLSTHAGVREAARQITSSYSQIDILLHTTGVLIMQEARTADGLHPFFAVNYLSRYHLTQLLLPLLRQSASGRVIMLTANVSLSTRMDFDLFPRYEPFKFASMKGPIQLGNHHYAAHLRATEPSLLAGVVNAGVARTGIWRETPLPMRLVAAVLGPILFDSVPTCAKNPVELCVRDTWTSGSYWGKPGKPDRLTRLELDPRETAQVIAGSRALTGA